MIRPIDWQHAIKQIAGKAVTIMGLGHHGGGVAAARFFALRGARVTISDMANEKTLVASLEALRDVPISHYGLGGHQQDHIRHADILVVNPAIRPDNRFLQFARRSGIPITTETELFLRSSPAQVIGVTGTLGKSTTATMIAEMIRAGGRQCWLGGNIGRSLLPVLENIRATDWVVLELSSFQLSRLADSAPVPSISVVTNCFPHHLDWHASFEHYVAAKQWLLRNQGPREHAIINDHDPIVSGWNLVSRGHLISPCCKFATSLADHLSNGHNRQNAALAAAAALQAGCDESSIRGALSRFAGLSHRLERLEPVAGRLFVNDSKSTTSAATVAALSAIAGPSWLIAGGYDQGADFSRLCRLIANRSNISVVLYGAAAQRIENNLIQAGHPGPIKTVHAIAEAVTWCHARSEPGDTILLSPACSSFDQFTDFQQRGREFVRCVQWLREATDPGTESDQSDIIVRR